ADPGSEPDLAARDARHRRPAAARTGESAAGSPTGQPFRGQHRQGGVRSAGGSVSSAVQHRPAAPVPDAEPERAIETAAVEVGAADRDAEFTSFVRDHSRDLSRTAWLLCGDAGRAEELVQAALVRTYVAWPTARQGEPLAYAR